jgi:hypothetical protein
MLSSLITITSINLLKLLSEKARSTGLLTREFHMCGELSNCEKIFQHNMAHTFKNRLLG